MTQDAPFTIDRRARTVALEDAHGRQFRLSFDTAASMSAVRAGIGGKIKLAYPPDTVLLVRATMRDWEAALAEIGAVLAEERKAVAAR